MLKAIVFDMDGVLTDSEPFYREAINRILAEHGYSLSEDDYKAVLGHGIPETWEWMLAHFDLPYTLDEVMLEYDQVVERVLRERVKPTPGLQDLLASLKKRGLKMAVASASYSNWVDAVLVKLGVKQYFSVVLSANMVRNGKPHPEIYLTAAEKLGVPPRDCLAVEDSPTGIKAAKAAGMRVVALVTPYTQDMDTSQADARIESLTQLIEHLGRNCLRPLSF